MSLIFVDVEAFGGAPSVGQLVEIGAVEYETGDTFYRRIVKSVPDSKTPAIPIPSEKENPEVLREAFSAFDAWLSQFDGKPVFVSDNNGYDWQWINDGFWRTLGRNPFGFSSRRISDFYAGLRGDFRNTQEWKKLRKTKHDHNPVNDAKGNAEAFRAFYGEKN